MHEENVDIDRASFVTMLKLCRVRREAERAFFYLDEMGAYSLEPTLGTFRHFFSACSTAPHFVAGYEVRGLRSVGRGVWDTWLIWTLDALLSVFLTFYSVFPFLPSSLSPITVPPCSPAPCSPAPLSPFRRYFPAGHAVRRHGHNGGQGAKTRPAHLRDSNKSLRYR
jgi:hypothetical protein